MPASPANDHPVVVNTATAYAEVLRRLGRDDEAAALEPRPEGTGGEP